MTPETKMEMLLYFDKIGFKAESRDNCVVVFVEKSGKIKEKRIHNIGHAKHVVKRNLEKKRGQLVVKS